MRLRPERRPLGLPGPRAPGSRLLGDSVTRCRPCARQPRPPSHAAPRVLPGTACSFRSPLFARLRRRDEASTGRCCGLSACPQVRSRKPVLGAGLAAMRTGGSHTVPGLDSLTAMRSGPLQGGPRVSLLGGAACWGGRPIPPRRRRQEHRAAGAGCHPFSLGAFRLPGTACGASFPLGGRPCARGKKAVSRVCPPGPAPVAARHHLAGGGRLRRGSAAQQLQSIARSPRPHSRDPTRGAER